MEETVVIVKAEEKGADDFLTGRIAEASDYAIGGVGWFDLYHTFAVAGLVGEVELFRYDAIMGGAGNLAVAFILPVMGTWYDTHGASAAFRYVAVLPIVLTVIFAGLVGAGRFEEARDVAAYLEPLAERVGDAVLGGPRARAGRTRSPTPRRRLLRRRLRAMPAKTRSSFRRAIT